MIIATLAGKALVFWRRLRHQCPWHGRHCRPELHAPLPPKRFCAYRPCGSMLADDAPAGQKYCKPTHRRKAQQARGKPARKLKAAWTLNSSYEAHAASCARKTANGGAYDTLGDALQALRWLREADGSADDDRSAYQCLACAKFHTTSHADRAIT